VAGLRRAEDLSVGSGFACAVEQGGTVACWGDNDRAQLGDGSKTARALPVRVVGLDDATAVAAGSSHACARRRDGHAVCWGNNDRGQLGGGAAGEASAALVEVGVLDDAARLALGEDHSCALDVGGKVWCWGSNARGQLGLGHTRHVTTPAHVQGIADVTAIAAGDEVTCALCRDGSVWCWGAFLPPLRGAWSPIATSL
jgi:alpha-tubulin suppressor-like RCC1 family protein